jgi:hypothetical protein
VVLESLETLVSHYLSCANSQLDTSQEKSYKVNDISHNFDVDMLKSLEINNFCHRRKEIRDDGQKGSKDLLI